MQKIQICQQSPPATRVRTGCQGCLMLWACKKWSQGRRGRAGKHIKLLSVANSILEVYKYPQTDSQERAAVNRKMTFPRRQTARHADEIMCFPDMMALAPYPVPFCISKWKEEKRKTCQFQGHTLNQLVKKNGCSWVSITKINSLCMTMCPS